MFRLYRHAGFVFLVVCSTLCLVAGGVEAFPPPQGSEQKGTAPPGLLNTYSPQSQTAPNPTVTRVTSLRSPPSLLGTRPVAESGGAVTDDAAEVLRPVAVQTSRPTSSGIPTGGDNCNETTPNAVAVPGAISIFGDNSAATGPDDCTGFNMGTIWWESFTITQCADVEITFCGSNPKIPSNWVFVTESCSADGSTCFGLFGASAANRAVCADENIWMRIEGLPAGTYYYPIISSTTSNYQMNVTTFECSGACCNSTARTCSDNVLESNCQGVDEQLFASETCASSGCTGACCNQTAGTCLDNVFAIDCADTFLGGEQCCTVECRDPAGPEFDALGVKFLSRVSLADFSADFGSTHGNASEMWGYTSPSGREYAIIALDLATAFVEVTNPLAPVIIAQIPSPSSSTKDVKTFGQFALVVIEFVGPGLQIIDLSLIDSGTVTLVSTANPGGFISSHNVVVNEDSGFAYIVSTDVNFGFTALDMTNPLVPVAVGDWTEASVHDMQVVSYTSGIYAGREIAFVCAPFNAVGFWIVDVTDKNNMFTRGTIAYPNASIGHQGWLTEDRKYFIFGDEGDENSFGVPTTTYVFDVQNLDAPFLHTTFSNGGCTVDHNMIVHGDNVYQANYETGLRIWNLADINSITEVGHFDTHPEDNGSSFNGAWGTYPLLPSGIVLVSDRQRGLFVLDVGQAITGACCESATGICTNNAIADDCAGTFFKGLPCVDVTCPDAPLVVKFSQLPKGNGEDIPSNIDWVDEDPNIVAADDWVSDGRVVSAVRWWGSNLVEPPPVCGPGNGDCCVENPTPGCDDETCCNLICALDPFCCDVEWDFICAGEAEFDCVICGGGGSGLFASDPQGANLGHLDPDTGLFTVIGPFTGAPTNITEIEWSPDGNTLYAATGTGAATLHTVDPTTGTILTTVTHGLAVLQGMEFDAGGILLGTDIICGCMATIDPITGSTVAFPPHGFGAVGGLAFDATFTTLFGITSAGAVPPTLLSFNPGTGAAAVIAVTTMLTEASSLEFTADGRLIAGGADGLLYEINTVTGVAIPIGPLVNANKLSGITLRPGSSATFVLSEESRAEYIALRDSATKASTDTPGAVRPEQPLVETSSVVRGSLDLTRMDPGGSSASGELATGPPGSCAADPSFESGSFASWITTDMTVPFFPLVVDAAGISPGFGFFLSAPTDGVFAALHGWDGDGPGTISIAQDVTLSVGATTLEFDYRAAWDLLTFGGTLNRTFEVVIRPTGGGGALQTDLILTALAGTINLDTGNLVGVVDVSAFAGGAVRISFEWFVPENFSGPAFFQLDNVRCVDGGPPPTTEPDGWFISFHEPPDPADPATPPLGLYFCDAADVNQITTSLPACDGHPVIEYFVTLNKCCLVHSNPDSRTGFTPAVKDAFFEEKCGHYAIDIQAVIGHRYEQDPVTLQCIEFPTGNEAFGDFWGWHTTDNERGRNPALETSISMSGVDWLYGPWNPVVPACSLPNMAFELLTPDPVTPNPDDDDDGIPDACQCQPSARPISTLVDTGSGIGNRTLVLETDAVDAGRTQAIRVVFTDLDPPYDVWNGEELWLQNPTPRCEHPGTAFPPCPLGPTFWAAQLGCTPFYTDWSSFGGPIHAYHEGVIPASLYTVAVIDELCVISDPVSFSPPLNMATSRFGDVSNFFSGVDWPPPDSGVDIVSDTIAVLSKFSSNPTAPISSRADLEPRDIDWRINITDVLQTVNGFTGLSYPFVPSVGDPCP